MSPSVDRSIDRSIDRSMPSQPTNAHSRILLPLLDSPLLEYGHKLSILIVRSSSRPSSSRSLLSPRWERSSSIDCATRRYVSLVGAEPWMLRSGQAEAAQATSSSPSALHWAVDLVGDDARSVSAFASPTDAAAPPVSTANSSSSSSSTTISRRRCSAATAMAAAMSSASS